MGSKQERRRENDEQAKLDKFCSYCRKVLRNANTDVLRAQARRAKRVTLFSDLCEAELDRLACPFSYGTEETVFDVAGHEVASWAMASPRRPGAAGGRARGRPALLLRGLERPTNRRRAGLLALYRAGAAFGGARWAAGVPWRGGVPL